jgi:hypothetical protein
MWWAVDRDAGVSDTAITGPCRSYAAFVAAAGIALGILAFAADFVDGAAGRIVVGLTSSGFVWGLTAFLFGRAAIIARQAAIGAAAVLVVATLLYYLLVLVVSRRWSGGTLEDGTSANLQGLRSVAVMTTVWLVGSVIAGPVFGLLGHLVRTGRTLPASAAAGLTAGLLSGEGLQALMWTRPWRLPAADPHWAEFVHGVLVSELVKIALLLAVLVWLVRAHHLRRGLPLMLTAATISGLLTALIWHSLHAVTNRI